MDTSSPSTDAPAERASPHQRAPLRERTLFISAIVVIVLLEMLLVVFTRL